MSRINLNPVLNNSCQRKCNKETRKDKTENDLCEVLSEQDNLPVRCVGGWAEQKIYLLYQYFGIFTVGMKDKWPKRLNYIEICSGSGRCISRTSGTEIDGTALSILKHDAYKYINKALFFDFNQKVVDVLNQRIRTLGVQNAKAYVADYNKENELCNLIRSELKNDSLNIVFIDPTDCSVPFSLLKRIKETLSNVDFIINVATGTDFNRNIPMAFKDANRAIKYCHFLGNNTFFADPDNIDLAKHGDWDRLRIKFRETYMMSLRNIDYQHFDIKTIKHYYDILFAAKHKTAIDFWRKATAIEYTGQRAFDF